MFLVTPIARAFQTGGVFAWDVSLTLLNLVLPNRKVGHVVPEGHPGAGGVWPEYIAPKEGDSRCSCPVLNAMANHGSSSSAVILVYELTSSYCTLGVLPRDGRNISFKELNATIRATCNFSPSFCFFVPNFAANMLNKSYSKDTFDLAELDLHNGIEHDASLTSTLSPTISDGLTFTVGIT
jgi:Peroxidase, family 2